MQLELEEDPFKCSWYGLWSTIKLYKILTK
jgi:hypothetical protein